MLLVHVHINGMIHVFDVGKTLYTGSHFHLNLLEMKVGRRVVKVSFSIIVTLFGIIKKSCKAF